MTEIRPSAVEKEATVLDLEPAVCFNIQFDWPGQPDSRLLRADFWSQDSEMELRLAKLWEIIACCVCVLAETCLYHNIKCIYSMYMNNCIPVLCLCSIKEFKHFNFSMQLSVV